MSLAAQGLAAARPTGTPNIGHLTRAVRSMGILQIDSVNVVERAHQVTLFSRLGPYDPDLVWRALEERRIFEYWGRMASFLPIEDYGLYRWRMDAIARRHADGEWTKLADIVERAPTYVEDVYRQVVERGPLAPADLEDPGERGGPWWGWADGKVALEHLFITGRLSVAHRRNFTRYYDVTERVIPEEHRQVALPADEARRQLIRQAAKALGVGTARDIIDYYWIRVEHGRQIIDDLVADGELIEVQVEGWSEPGYLHSEVGVPRSVDARSLINPFDPMAWNRDRLERLHDFHYRIEIYVPPPKRVYGYYVYPFLLGDDLVARVDLKADRKPGVLRVPGAFAEGGVDRVRVARELAAELRDMAGWLGLGEIEVGEKGDLAGELRKAV
ncbi:MAG TPA: crosslink repair DNA glycosylase YcaQ family protein [Acidimicrobiia bacterium]|nr:crosslink repair DNA glycosylase YcaQ family protein [Acidimicrobiia bacterium]